MFQTPDCFPACEKNGKQYKSGRFFGGPIGNEKVYGTKDQLIHEFNSDR
jgi:hypothetical protein